MYGPAQEVEAARPREAGYAYQREVTSPEYGHYPRKKTRWKLGLGMFALGFMTSLVLVVGAGIGVYYLRFTATNGLSNAVDACHPAPGAVRLSTDRSTLTMDAYGEGRNQVSTPILLCILDELHAPRAMHERMNATRAIDGMQEEQWGPYRATWTYHPDQGLHVVISSN